jgi:hypothetical protein
MTTTRANSRSCVAVMARTAAGVAMLLGLTSPVFGQARGPEGVWGVVTHER